MAEKLLEKWTTQADAHGEGESELAAAWRVALERIIHSDKYSDLILKALSTLGNEDVLQFLDCIKRSRRNGGYPRRRLTKEIDTKSKELAERIVDVGLISEHFRLIPVVPSILLISAALLIQSFPS